jgi:ADP-heptose:LPS heptosyltransferase
MASVLFIAPADLGETVLATGALAHAMGADGEAAVVCGAEAALLFRALPGLQAVHAVGRGAGVAAWAGLWFKLAGAPFDLCLDGRGVALSRLLGARRRIVARPGAFLRHRVEDWTDWMGAERALAPKLWLDEAARAAAAEFCAGPEPILALAPGGMEAAKRWPAERYAAIARRLIGGPLLGGRVVLLAAAARDVAITRAIAASLAADGVAAHDLGARLDLLGAAALMERATLAIGNDNALTHIAAAAGAPTLTLFGPTDERVRAPYGARTRTLRGGEYELIAGLQKLAERSLLEDISVDAVEAAAEDLLRAGGLR